MTGTKEQVQELQLQLKTAIPTTLSKVLSKLPWLISLHFVGNMGSDELAAASFATALCDVTSVSFAFGMSSAVTTLAGQARGEIVRVRLEKLENAKGKYLEEGKQTTTVSPLIYLYRGIVIDIVLVLPVSLMVLHGISSFVLSTGLSSLLSSMTKSYLLMLVPGLMFYTINFILTAFLQALEMANIPAFAAFVALLTHIPFNILFINVFKLGYLGVAVATTMFQVIQPIVVIIYLISSAGRKRLVKECFVTAENTPSMRELLYQATFSLKGIYQYLSLGFPGLVAVSEFWASNLAMFLSTRLTPYPSLAMDVMSLYHTIHSSCFMFPLGASVAGSTRVGTCLGIGDVQTAILSAKVCVMHSAALSFSLASLLFFISPKTLITSLFTHNVFVQEETAEIMVCIALYVLADGIQVGCQGIIKGCGKQWITMPIVVISYWIVGVPLAYCFSFIMNKGSMKNCEYERLCGIKGLVIGMTIGTWVHMILSASAVIFATDWELEVQKAKDRCELEQEICDVKKN